MLAFVWLALATGAPAPAAQRPESPPSAASAWLSSVQAAAQRSEHEGSARVRARLAARARKDAEACLAQVPGAAACYYARAIALGLAARARPVHARALLKRMLDSLARAEAGDPDLDHAGPARVRALVLIRAPRWPLGPGDVEEGLAAARRAVSLHPEYPPNWLAMAEAQAKAGAKAESQESYAKARGAALAWPPSHDRDAWLHEADDGLRRK